VFLDSGFADERPRPGMTGRPVEHIRLMAGCVL